MIRINLLPVRAAQKKERLVNQLAILIFAVSATLVVCFLVWMSMSGRIDDATATNKATQNKINSLKKDLRAIKGFEVSKKALRAKLDILDKLKANRSGPVKLLDELSKSTPEKVWILTFSETAGAVTMTGGGMSEESIAGFLRDLENSPSYKNVELAVIEQKKLDDNDYLSFKISCSVETPVQPGLKK